MSKHWKRTLSLLTVAAAVGLVSAGLALAKKPPKPPPPPPPPPPIEYSITFLCTLPGDVTSQAYDVNGSGEVVGWFLRTEGTSSAFVYKNALQGMVALNDLIDHPDPQDNDWNLLCAEGINDAGQIVGGGYLNGNSEEKRAYRFTPGYTDENGIHPPLVEDLGTLPGGSSSHANAINDHGDVVGVSKDENGTDRAFVYTDLDGNGTEEMADIGDLGGALGYARPYGINESGQITGNSAAIVSNSRAFRYTPGEGMEDLGHFGTDPTSGLRSYARDINDDGHVVGTAWGAPKTKGWLGQHAFLYTDHMIDLGTLGGWYSAATGVNSSDHVVGVSHVNTKDAHDAGFLYIEELGMLKLEDLIPGFQGPIEPEKINDAGQIVGEADGEAFLLTPLP